MKCKKNKQKVKRWSKYSTNSNYPYGSGCDKTYPNILLKSKFKINAFSIYDFLLHNDKFILLLLIKSNILISVTNSNPTLVFFIAASHDDDGNIAKESSLIVSCIFTVKISSKSINCIPSIKQHTSLYS